MNQERQALLSLWSWPASVPGNFRSQWGSGGGDGVAAEGRELGALAFRLSLSLTFSTSEQTASLTRTWFSQLPSGRPQGMF